MLVLEMWVANAMAVTSIHLLDWFHRRRMFPLSAPGSGSEKREQDCELSNYAIVNKADKSLSQTYRHSLTLTELVIMVVVVAIEPYKGFSMSVSVCVQIKRIDSRARLRP